MDEVDEAEAPIDAHIGCVDAVEAFDTFDWRDCGRDEGVDWDSFGGATPSNWWCLLVALYLAVVSHFVAKSYAAETKKFNYVIAVTVSIISQLTFKRVVTWFVTFFKRHFAVKPTLLSIQNIGIILIVYIGILHWTWTTIKWLLRW